MADIHTAILAAVRIRRTADVDTVIVARQIDIRGRIVHRPDGIRVLPNLGNGVVRHRLIDRRPAERLVVSLLALFDHIRL